MLFESPAHSRRIRPSGTKLNGARNAHKLGSNARKLERVLLAIIVLTFYSVVVAQLAIAHAMEGLKCP